MSSYVPETCVGRDMDCGRPLPCPDHPALQHKRHYGVPAYPEIFLPGESGYPLTGMISGYRDLPPNDWGVLSIFLYDDATPVPVHQPYACQAQETIWRERHYWKVFVHCGPAAPYPDTATRRRPGA